ncbi:MAG: purine-nucleoside phosphorylase [Planctomyces sp.]|nr:purine-nucleoside phosphorylase [Planctomyces sp.]
METIPADDEPEVAAAVDVLRSLSPAPCSIGLILGTGMGDVALEIAEPKSLSYDRIPGLAAPTAVGHRGNWTCGRFAGQRVSVMAGRCHRYEGHSLQRITRPIRILRRLGVRTLIVTNASGGLHPNHRVGDVLAIDDHLDLMSGGTSGGGFSSGPNRRGWSGSIYDPELTEWALRAARRAGIPAHRGTYISVTGPNYETRAEYRCYRRLGGDAIGMSTAPEASAAAALGMRVLGLSTITNVCRPDRLEGAEGELVASAAAAAAPRIARIIREVLWDLGPGNAECGEGDSRSA